MLRGLASSEASVSKSNLPMESFIDAVSLASSEASVSKCYPIYKLLHKDLSSLV